MSSVTAASETTAPSRMGQSVDVGGALLQLVLSTTLGLRVCFRSVKRNVL
jgi:hypothetical protein